MDTFQANGGVVAPPGYVAVLFDAFKMMMITKLFYFDLSGKNYPKPFQNQKILSEINARQVVEAI